MQRMTPRTKKAFDIFVNNANIGGLHQHDWQRFYRFVRTAHRYRSQIWEQEVTQALVEVGFSEKYAVDIGAIYTHCWQMLSRSSHPKEAKERRRRLREQLETEIADARQRREKRDFQE
jgi:hypothetical protein